MRPFNLMPVEIRVKKRAHPLELVKRVRYRLVYDFRVVPPALQTWVDLVKPRRTGGERRPSVRALLIRAGYGQRKPGPLPTK